MKRTVMVLVCVLTVGLMLAGVAEANDWTKLGRKTLLFKDNGGEIKVKNQQEVSELMIQVGNAQVNLEGVKVVFADGAEKKINVEETLRPGVDSEPIGLGTTKALTSVELMFDTVGRMGSTRVPTTIFGK